MVRPSVFDDQGSCVSCSDGTPGHQFSCDIFNTGTDNHRAEKAAPLPKGKGSEGQASKVPIMPPACKDSLG